MELDYRLIGNRIGARIRYLGFGQEQLAQLVGLSKTHISNIENGKAVPSVEAVVGIADALETTPDAFLLGANRDLATDQHGALAARIGSCNDLDRKYLSIIVEAIVEKSNHTAK